MRYTIFINQRAMITQEDHDFVSFLFSKLIKHVDVDMLDLHNDDSCCDHLHFEQLDLGLEL